MLQTAVAGLSPKQLDTPCRDGGWTVRQVVHHYADDRINTYVRFKLALTEEAPLIKEYSRSLVGRTTRRSHRSDRAVLGPPDGLA